jgi:hypothetical protein
MPPEVAKEFANMSVVVVLKPGNTVASPIAGFCMCPGGIFGDAR